MRRVLVLCALLGCRAHFDPLETTDASSMRDGAMSDVANACANVAATPTSGIISGTLSTSPGGDASGTCGGAGLTERAYSIDVTVPGSQLLLAADDPSSTADTLIYARTTCDSAASEVACDNDAGINDGPEIRMLTPALGRYYVFVDGDTQNGSDGTGDFSGELAVLLPTGASCNPGSRRDRCGPELVCQSGTCMPAGCAGATALSGSNTYDKTGATTGGLANHAGSCGPANDGGIRAPEAIFTLALPAAVTNVDVSTGNPGTDFDTLIYMRNGCAGTEIGCDDDSGGANNQSKFDTGPLAAGTYYIFVDGFSLREGSYELTVTVTP